MISMLERTRKINRLLQKSGVVEYDEVARVLSDVMAANVYIVGREGALFGYALQDGFECDVMKEKVLELGKFPERYVSWLLRISDTSPNLQLKDSQCTFADGMTCIFSDKFTTIVPIHGVGERIGTLIVAKFHNQFTDDDLLLAEYGATVVGLEILRDQSEQVEEEARKKAAVQVALGSLSYTELEAAKHVLGEMEGNEVHLVASRIADRVGITRSVIVNTLRKLESAGVVETKSLGMKGTYIKVLNDRLIEELDKR